jgi:lysophospholipid acyltransferase (LPLAT)-like uncharacterized protein
VEPTPVHRFQGWGLSTYAALVRDTALYRVEGKEHLDRVDAAGRPTVIASWHGMTMMMAGFISTREDASRYVLIVPDDPRGAVLSIWARRLGAASFAISMEAESMVAARRLLALIRQLRERRKLYVNPDGPDGPTHEPKAGVIYIARKARAPIVPAAAFTATSLRIPRWDRYVVPLPFSRIVVFLGEAMEVSPDVDPEQARRMLRERLNEVERTAEARYRAGT